MLSTNHVHCGWISDHRWMYSMKASVFWFASLRLCLILKNQRLQPSNCLLYPELYPHSSSEALLWQLVSSSIYIRVVDPSWAYLSSSLVTQKKWLDPIICSRALWTRILNSVYTYNQSTLRVLLLNTFYYPGIISWLGNANLPHFVIFILVKRKVDELFSLCVLQLCPEES